MFVHPFETTFKRRKLLIYAAAAVLVLCCLSGFVASRSRAANSGRPNVLLIVTDDQRFDEVRAMPNVRRLIADQGVTFRRAYVTYPLCCPSRTSVLTGLYTHNHQVEGNNSPTGGWKRFSDLHESESTTLPVQMKQYRYKTAFAGKYMNGYMRPERTPPVKPSGWDTWYAKTSAGGPLDVYFNWQMASSTNALDPPDYVQYGSKASDYATDVLGTKALEFLKSRQWTPSNPFFLAFWPFGPHWPFQPAPRDNGDFKHVQLTLSPDVNEKDMSDKPRWLRKATKKIPEPTMRQIQNERKKRLEQMVSVDAAIGRLIAELKQQRVLDKTYIIFTSDNGYFRGEHRIPSGKYLPYEPSARVPLIIMGPGIPEGKNSRELVSLMDIPQTVLEVASGSENPNADGRSLLPYARNPRSSSDRPLLLEGFTNDESEDGSGDPSPASNPAVGLRGVDDLEQEPGGRLIRRAYGGRSRARIIKAAPAYLAIRTSRYLLIAYGNDERELYDMKLDPHQLDNVAGSARYSRVRRWMLELLNAYEDCAGQDCRREASSPPRLPRRERR